MFFSWSPQTHGIAGVFRTSALVKGPGDAFRAYLRARFGYSSQERGLEVPEAMVLALPNSASSTLEEGMRLALTQEAQRASRTT
jgi:hypothetical protein